MDPNDLFVIIQGDFSLDFFMIDWDSLLKPIVLLISCLYQFVSSWREDRHLCPGQRVNVGNHYLHYCVKQYCEEEGYSSEYTIVVDHSLGGVEGYLLQDELAKLGRVCIYERAGYGWSDHSLDPRHSQHIVQELDCLLTNANIDPPYLLVGDSFGSYTVRLYAYLFPEKVVGLVLTDPLHEIGMLNLSIPLKALKLFFISGFLMSVIGSTFGLIRLLRSIGSFELIKPELRQFRREILDPVKYSFCRPKHWITMTREMLNLDLSGSQLAQVAQSRSTPSLGDLPIVLIQAHSFFMPSLWTTLLPLKSANQLREKMHRELRQLSTEVTQLNATRSGHFVWVDQPEILVEAVNLVLEKSRQRISKHTSDL